MIRFLFPKVSFSGRLDRAGFWREIMLSASTTPIAVGFVTHLAHEGARAAERGLVVDNANGKAVVGLLLTVYALRNSLVFAGVVRRRLNDLGLEGLRVFKPTVPLFLFAGTVIMISLLTRVHLGSGQEIVVGVATFVAVAVVWWQIAHVFNLGYQVMFGASGALAGGRTAPPMPRETHTAFTDLRERFDTAMKDLKSRRGSKPAGFEAIDTLFAPMIDTLNEWAKPATVGEKMSAGRGAREDLRVSAKPKGRELPAGSAREQQHAHSKPANSQARPGQAVVAARHEPQTGRSRWYSGLLTGPWG